MSESYFMTTQRLGFRCWGENDLPLAMSVWGDPKVTRFVGGPFTESQVAARLAKEITSMREHRIQYWPIFLREDGRHVGCAGMRMYNAAEKIFATGYYLTKSFWGMGLAQEAGRAVIAHAFDELGASALFAGHHPENAVSRRVLAKLGFRYTHDELFPPTGLLHPSYLLTRAEFEQQRKSGERSHAS
ncbi:MAG TPA: GNAT family N-acetyltransferase [Candidatus Acidoferrales bacterium]|nr:GNAT family N-acetyltransferase [Candidatus Acidoferrales bacterium]